MTRLAAGPTFIKLDRHHRDEMILLDEAQLLIVRVLAVCSGSRLMATRTGGKLSLVSGVVQRRASEQEPKWTSIHPS
jgi:hypothetical protein